MYACICQAALYRFEGDVTCSISFRFCKCKNIHFLSLSLHYETHTQQALLRFERMYSVSNTQKGEAPLNAEKFRTPTSAPSLTPTKLTVSVLCAEVATCLCVYLHILFVLTLMIANAYVFPTRFTLSFRIVSNEVVQFHRAVQTALSEMKMDTGESKHPASIAYAA